jgi:hypothetical protein
MTKETTIPGPVRMAADGAASGKPRRAAPRKAGPGKAGSGKGGPGKAGGAEAVPTIGNFVLIIGAMKSGTTSLYDYLVTHPEIAACARKEPSFFAADRRAKLPRRYYRLWPEFDPARHRYAMEASVDYTKQPRYPTVMKRIGAFPGRFKFIYIVRDPVDRIESHLAHNIAKGRITRDDYASRLPSAVSISRYGYQLDAFRAPLGDPEVLLLDFDELRRDPMTLLGRVVDFLGIDPGFAFAPRPPSNTRKAENGGDTFRLSAEERARFRAELAPDMARFARAYGFDVTRWGFPAPEAIEAEPVAPKVPAAPRARPAPAEPAAAEAESGASGYWDRRRDMIYYDYLRRMVGRFGAEARSLIDVGAHETPLAEEFDWIPERVALDIRAPYSSPAVTGIRADFRDFEPGRRYDFALCAQVLEQVPEPEAFARKLLGIADRVLVSVPYRWPAAAKTKGGAAAGAPIDKATLARWFGRAPDHMVIAQEPFQTGPTSRRLIAYFHDAAGPPFSLKSPGSARRSAGG